MTRLQIVKDQNSMAVLKTFEAMGQRRPLFIIAVIGILFGLYLLVAQLAFQFAAQEVTGHIMTRDSENFVIQYNLDGHNYEITESLPGQLAFVGGSTFEVGSAEPVLYSPNAPEKGQWRSSRNWAFPAIIIIMSGLFALTILNPQLLRAKKE